MLVASVDSVEENTWQLNQSNETKTKNLEQEWEDLAAWAKEFGWSKDEDNNSEKMEGPSIFVNARAQR